jgi:nucleotide-binding universal stress UspA family protein
MRTPVLRTIVAATDLTEASDEVLRAAAGLARDTGAALHVVHAFDFPPSPYVEDAGDQVTFQGRIDDAERALDAQLARTVPLDVPIVGRRMEIYAAHRAITEYAGAVHADLVVLGPHTRRELEIGFLGTTADRVVRTAAAPVLIVRGALRLPFRRTVVPIDLSEKSGGVLDVALAWAQALGARDAELGIPAAELHIVHVVPDVFAGAPHPFGHASVHPGVNREVAAALERAGGASSVDVREEVLWGDKPAAEIAAYARSEGADLVILATHGYGALKRALIGSTAAGVAREAPCPVLLLPPRLWRNDDPERDAADASAGMAATG